MRFYTCLNCGQVIFIKQGDELPVTCDYCSDATTWKEQPPSYPTIEPAPPQNDEHQQEE
jgi:DNA-directed RNA polymerase subunit RPC12/RpoP